MAHQLKLSTRSQEFSGNPATLRLGGVTIYGPDESALRRSVQQVADAIDRCSRPHLSLVRVTLNSEVKKHLNETIDRRIFGAILGSNLRLGVLDSVPVASKTGKVFRIYIHCTQIDAFQRHLDFTERELRRCGVVHVRDIEAKMFGQRRWGTWSSASHVLGRLVQLGRAWYVDDDSYRWLTEIDDAIK